MINLPQVMIFKLVPEVFNMTGIERTAVCPAM